MTRGGRLFSYGRGNRLAARAQRHGVDVRGYYHWTLYDSFEWASGFVPRFGLYRTDYTTYARTPTKGAEVLSTIAASRTVTRKQRALFGFTDVGLLMLKGRVGVAYTFVDRWDVYVRFTLVERDDKSKKESTLPILDGGFDQQQTTFGLVYHFKP